MLTANPDLAKFHKHEVRIEKFKTNSKSKIGMFQLVCLEFRIPKFVFRISPSVNNFFSRSEQSKYDRGSRGVVSNGMCEIDKF